MSVWNLAIALFLIMDPVGNINAFLQMLDRYPPTKKRLIIVREMCFALIAMLIFNFLGETIFKLLQLQDVTLQLASGLILFLTAIKILFPSPNNLRDNLPKHEPFVTPLAIPLIAGPSLLATIMFFAHLEPSIAVMLQAIFIAWIAALIILLFSPLILRALTKNGVIAAERLMGMILILLAIQRTMEGIKQLIINLSH